MLSLRVRSYLGLVRSQRIFRPRDAEWGNTTTVTVKTSLVEEIMFMSHDTIIGSNIAVFKLAVTILIACLLSTAAITILASLHKTATLVGAISACTLFFAIILMFFTPSKPSRTEISAQPLRKRSILFDYLLCALSICTNHWAVLISLQILGRYGGICTGVDWLSLTCTPGV